MYSMPSFLRVHAIASLIAALFIAGCSSGHYRSETAKASKLINIHLLAFNDLHGHLEPPGITTKVPLQNGQTQAIATGGTAWLAGTIEALRAEHPHHAVVSAGDMVGSSPLLSSFFLDEPTIEAANAMRVDFAAVGNHEFDRGWPELLRLAQGGCERYTQREPCQISDEFAGANFPLLAANVRKQDGKTLLPATGLKQFEQQGKTVTIGFIGMTLQATPQLVMASAVQGLEFMPEAQTANALVPQLLHQGADVIVVLLHEGAYTNVPPFENGCSGLSGPLTNILEQLDPRISVVISGHTHQTYVCDYSSINPSKPFLLTSAGLYGTQLTDIELRWNTEQRKLQHRSARTLAVPATAQAASTQSPAVLNQTQVHGPVQTVIDRYRSVITKKAQQTVGHISSPDNTPLAREPNAHGEIQLGNLIADAQAWAMQNADLGGADISFMHSGGIRAGLQPGTDGSIRFEQLYAIQPFGNTLLGMTLTGQQILELLEDSYLRPKSSSGRTRILSPNAALSWRHDAQAPQGQQVKDVTVHGQPMLASAYYRVVVSSFLAQGGDRYPIFDQGTHRIQGPTDIDALENYVRAHSPLTAPALGRIR